MQPQLAEHLIRLNAHALQLERIIWLMATDKGGAMVVDEASINPLWNTKYERVKDHKTLLKISAECLPEPTEKQFEKLAALLDGKPQAEITSALLQVGLSLYPPVYVMARLAPLARCVEGVWKSPATA